jgi:hypothetical protein
MASLFIVPKGANVPEIRCIDSARTVRKTLEKIPYTWILGAAVSSEPRHTG